MTLMVNTMVTGLVSCSIFNWTSSITAVVQNRQKVYKVRGGGGGGGGGERGSHFTVSGGFTRNGEYKISLKASGLDFLGFGLTSADSF